MNATTTTPTEPVVPPRTGPLSRNSVYYAFAAVAAIVSLSLFVSYANKKDPIKVGTVSQDPPAKEFSDLREARPITVSADVTNRSKVARCPEMRVAALDVNAKNLAEVVAQPESGASGPARLEPGQTVRFEAVIVTLTLKDEREKLKNVDLYAYNDRRC